MAKVTRHGGPTHHAWVPITRPHLGEVDQCLGTNSMQSGQTTETESESTEPPQDATVSMMENPSLLTEQLENADSVGENTPVPVQETKPVRKRRPKKNSDDFDF